jgi:hypothetical protein
MFHRRGLRQETLSCDAGTTTGVDESESVIERFLVAPACVILGWISATLANLLPEHEPRSISGISHTAFVRP